MRKKTARTVGNDPSATTARKSAEDTYLTIFDMSTGLREQMTPNQFLRKYGL